MGTRTTRGRLLVQRIWTDSSKHGMKHIKSQFKKTKREKKKPLFLKHLNGWHQNVKCNIHFKNILKCIFMCNNKQEDKTHPKQEFKKNSSKKDKK